MQYVKSFNPQNGSAAPVIKSFPDNDHGLASAIDHSIDEIRDGARVLAFDAFSREILIGIPETTATRPNLELAVFLLIKMHIGLRASLAANSPDYGSAAYEENSNNGGGNSSRRSH